jgi:flagella basal body P-ring formation protein FlgA
MASRIPGQRMLALFPVLALCAGTSSAATATEPDAHAVAVRLHASAVATRPDVLLGDVADVEGRDMAQVQHLRVLPLGRLDAAGTQAALERGAIAHWICVHEGLCGAQVAWSGAARVAIRKTLHTVASATLVDVAQQELQRTLAPLGARVEIEPLAAASRVELPPGRVEFNARPLPAGTVPGKRMTVWVDANVDGRFVRAVPVNFEVAAHVPAWIAKDALPTGARVTGDAFVPGEADLAGMPGGEPRRFADTFAGGAALVLRHALRPGEPLTTANSAPAPLVARGDIALLRIKDTAIELESRVEVLQDGLLGQRVRVKAKNAAGPVLARVTGAGRLEASSE